MAYEERPNGMTVDGQLSHTVRGSMLKPGDAAPDFELLTNYFISKTLADYEGKVKILSVVPSLDTSVCSAQTRRFNQEAAALGDDVVIITVSADLPFALGRFCAAEGIAQVEVLSSHHDMQFSDDYGVHNLDWRINMRAAFVLDKANKIVYAEYVQEMGNAVNFEAILQAAQDALG